MACTKREKTGTCSHHFCNYSHETDHGYECVEVIFGYCECGNDCLEKCDYSWPTGGREEELADEAFKMAYPE